MSKIMYVLIVLAVVVAAIILFPTPTSTPDSKEILLPTQSLAPTKSPTPSLPKTPRECIRTGCSGQICSDKDIDTTCEFREEYVCYKDAICERQLNEVCGWTMTKELIECLNAQ
jgi:eight-cysteine-cluster-containing protein